MLRLSCTFGRRGKLGHHQFEHPVIDQAYQAELLGDRDDIGRQQNLAVILLHADQALVERRLARAGFHHGLERHHDPALVERGDDLVGDADIDAALGVALDIRTPHQKRPGAAVFRHIQRFMGAVDGLVGIAGVTRHADRPDRCRDRDRTGLGRHDLVTNAGQKPFGGDIHVVDGAVLQDQPEFVAGKPAEHIAAAQAGANPGGDFRNHRVRHVEAESVIDARQMVDADQHEGERGAEACGFLDGLGQRSDQMGAIEFAGQGVVPRQFQQLLVAGVAFIVDADDALGARRPAVGAGKPAAAFLDPELRR